MHDNEARESVQACQWLTGILKHSLTSWTQVARLSSSSTPTHTLRSKATLEATPVPAGLTNMEPDSCRGRWGGAWVTGSTLTPALIPVPQVEQGLQLPAN